MPEFMIDNTTYTYTPDSRAQALNAAQTGNDVFTYTISDGLGGTSSPRSAHARAGRRWAGRDSRQSSRPTPSVEQRPDEQDGGGQAERECEDAEVRCVHSTLPIARLTCSGDSLTR